MGRDLLRYIGGFSLCILVNAVVIGLSSDDHHPESIWYALVVIVLYGAWGLYILPLLIFHVVAKYLKTYDYSSYIVLSILVWGLFGLFLNLLFGSSDVILSYLFIGLAYGFYYRIKLFDEAKAQ